MALFDSDSQLLADAAVRLTRSSPQSYWSEQSPEEWWHATLEAIAKVRADAPAGFSSLKKEKEELKEYRKKYYELMKENKLKKE